MIKIQKLKEPKKTSGKKLSFGKSCKLSGIEVKNNNRFDVYVDLYQRNKSAVKKKEKLDL